MGGTGGVCAYKWKSLEEICTRGLAFVSHQRIAIDESLIRWTEYEMEVVRAKKTTAHRLWRLEKL